MTSRVPEDVVWMRSSTSSGDDAVEIARLPDGEPHVYTAAEWDAFVKGVDAGEFDLPE